MREMEETTLKQLWEKHGKGESGRYPCRVKLSGYEESTHIYRGYGIIRLEQIESLVPGKKGFQGRELVRDYIYGAGRPWIFKIRG